jgi:hypothetical protein
MSDKLNGSDFQRAADAFIAKMRGQAQAAAATMPEQDPLSIPTEVYLLDALLMHAQAVCNQIARRGRTERAQQLAQVMGSVAALRNMLDVELRALIIPPQR